MKVIRKPKKTIFIIDKFCVLLTVCLIGLKIYGVYPINWIEVFIPLMATAAIYMYLLALVIGHIVVDRTKDNKDMKENENV